MAENPVIEPEKEPAKEAEIRWTEVLIEGLKGIKSEILVYAIAVAFLLVAASYFGIEFVRELKWPLLFIFSLALVAYFVARAIPQARMRLIRRQKKS